MINAYRIHPIYPHALTLLHFSFNFTKSITLSAEVCKTDIRVANSVDPDQMPLTVASESGMQFSQAHLSEYLVNKNDSMYLENSFRLNLFLSC